MPVQALFILNVSGDVLIEKHYRGLVTRGICDTFWDNVLKADTKADAPPIMSTPKFYLIHVQTEGLFFLALSARETSPLLIIQFLYRLVDVFKSYFSSVSEQIIKDNFVTVYQLLDEMMDNGVPFTTEPNILSEMITPPNLLSTIGSVFMGPGNNVTSVLPDASLTNVPWRRQGVKYTTNEVYFDILEEIDCIIDRSGSMIQCEARGEIQTNCKLSGMPDLSLRFTNARILDDVSFHHCVRYNRWEHDRVVSFIPPDGTFKLMEFRVTGQIRAPIYIKPQILYSNTGGKVHVSVGNTHVTDKQVEYVVITIPFSKTSGSATLSANIGAVHFDEIQKVCKWNIGKLPKDKTPVLDGTINLQTGAEAPESNPVITAEWKVVMWSASGLAVDSLTLHNEKFNPYKGVRSITKAGKFQIRS